MRRAVEASVWLDTWALMSGSKWSLEDNDWAEARLPETMESLGGQSQDSEGKGRIAKDILGVETEGEEAESGIGAVDERVSGGAEDLCDQDLVEARDGGREDLADTQLRGPQELEDLGLLFVGHCSVIGEDLD